MSETGGTPSPGWYPDPGGTGGQRWWDGTGWTDQVRAASPVAPAPGAAGSFPTSQPAGPPATNPKAIASLVLSLLWLGGLGAIAAIVLGVIARKEIKASHGRQQGDGMALAGIIIGGIGAAGIALLLVAAIAIPTALNQADRAADAEVQSELRNATVHMELHFSTAGRYSYDLDEVGVRPPSGITMNATSVDTPGQDYCLEASRDGSTWWRLSSDEGLLTEGRC